MSESTATKSNVYKEDLALATGGTGAEETGTRRTSTGGTVDLTKLDASHIKFQTLALSLDDLVDGDNDVHVKPSDISMDGTLTNASMSSAGYVKNNASGVLSGGNAIVAGDLPTGINAANIANGAVSNAEYQYLSGVTSDIQNQIDAAGTTAASQAEQEAGIEAAKYVAPATQKYHPSAAKAWAKWTANSTTILASYNVASITDGATVSTVNFTTAFSVAHYAVATCVENAGGLQEVENITAGAQAAGAVTLYFTNMSGQGTDPTSAHIICMGDQ